jgi:long-chain fatty acid transport protein
LVDEYTIGTYKITPKWQVSEISIIRMGKYNKLTLDFENALAGNQADDPTKM